jgi:hypothetical protein
MSNTVSKFILYNAIYKRATVSGTQAVSNYEAAMQHAHTHKLAFYEETARGKNIRFPLMAHGFAGFKVAEPNVKYQVCIGKNQTILSGLSGLSGLSEQKAHAEVSHLEDGLFGARDHYIGLNDGTENMRDPSIPGIMVRVHDDGLVYGRQYIPNSLTNLRLEMDKESDVTFFCFVVGSEEDKKIIQGPSEIQLGRYGGLRVK